MALPTNPMAPFDVFVGVWNTTGEVLQTASNPAGQLLATDTYRWLPGRHFIVHDVDARFDGQPMRSMEVMGYDAARRRHFARSFDDQGAMEDFVVELDGSHWRIRGKAVRFDGGFDAKWQRLEGLWELKGRKGWQPWIRLRLTRA
jgi:hypothetical protein